MRLTRAAKHMRFRIVGRSRFTGHRLEFELDAATADEAEARALRLGLADVDAKPMADQSTSADGRDRPVGMRPTR
jgi:hypothetical protein